ncbi:MAG: hypothetical protein AB8G11_15640 [Saprospiraceae bacterium]
MKKITFIIMFLGAIIVTFAACTSTKKTSTSCSTEGTAKDMTGLDGCKMMIVLQDGSRLNPMEYPENTFKLEDGQKIRFNYEVVDAMNVCMSGQTVKITCIELQ